MTHATDAAHAILRALIEAHSAGRPPESIILDEATQESLQNLGLGYWTAGPATRSLFNVPVVVGPGLGWQLRFPPEPDAAGITES